MVSLVSLFAGQQSTDGGVIVGNAVAPDHATELVTLNGGPHRLSGTRRLPIARKPSECFHGDANAVRIVEPPGEFGRCVGAAADPCHVIGPADPNANRVDV